MHVTGLSVLWIEALPTLHSILKVNLWEFFSETKIGAGARDGSSRTTCRLPCSSNEGASSSIYEFALHRDIWPEVTITHDIELVLTTLDEIAKKDGVEVSNVDALVMDTQSSELLVLKGRRLC